ANRLRGGAWVGHAFGYEQAQVLFRLKDAARIVIRSGGDDDLGEDLGDLCGSGAIQRLIERDDPAKGRGAVTVKGVFIRLLQGRRAGNAAGVGVFDDGAGGAVAAGELADQLERGVGVVDVVIAQVFALKLAGGRDARAR